MDLIGRPKMQIFAYSDPTFNQKVDEFTVLLNPENYTLNYEVKFAENQTPGTSGHELKFDKIKPQKLDFEFLFDRTGAIPEAGDIGDDGVQKDIDKLREVTLGYDGNIHRTRFLILSWGKLLFKCCLTNLSINYKLFRPDGAPLRATARAAFEEFREEEQRVREENNNSPDLTHIRTIKKGDTLPLMCHKIYGDSNLYLQIAQVNEITNFRNLEIGQKIFFPPIKKQ